jgi:hypothetical protein
MKKKILFVGDCDSAVATMAQDFDHTATLINTDNYQQYLQSTTGITGYTSLADLPKDLNIFISLLKVSDSIIYCPVTAWSDGKSADINDITSSMQGITEFWLYNIDKIKNNVTGLDVTKFDVTPYLSLADTRKTQDRQLWSVGCSTTFGVGVETTERYGYLLGKSLDLPVSFLAQPSSAISWAADQILRSDIKPNDIIVWGLTSENRLTLWDDIDKKNIHICPKSTKSDSILSNSIINKLLIHKTNFSTAIQRVHEVVNFCNKINAKLLILGIYPSDSLTSHLNNIKQFFPYTYPFYQSIDLGSDNKHPGPVQHQAYADFCQSLLKKLCYI